MGCEWGIRMGKRRGVCLLNLNVSVYIVLVPVRGLLAIMHNKL